MSLSPVASKKRSAEILLIEDNRGDAVLAARAFREAHVPTHMSLAASAEEALGMLRHEDGYEACAPPDLILLDLNLMRMHGHDFLKIVKADARLRHIPVVVLSSSRALHDVIASYDGYASGYIVKPLGLEPYRELVTAVEQFFFRQATLPDAADLEPNGGLL
ncbi:MAG: response regulator [Alphaproteobacteria bacterium]|nr:response regulator [Alphaproteobacteria bacterium]